MKILTVGDLHGNKPKIHYKNFDAIIAPGDFCSDALRKYMFQALRENLQNPDSEVMWYDITGKTKAKKMIKKSLADGRKILEYLNSFNVPVYMVPGNWDWTGDKRHKWDFLKQNHYKKLIGGLKNLVDVHHKIKNAGDFQIIGHGITSGPEFPQIDLDKYTRSELQTIRKDFKKQHQKVTSLFKKAKKPVIFLSHNVPYNTPLDMITDKRSPRCGYHFGSLIARQMIDKFKPQLCIGGHMHEHFRKFKMGKTIAINAGFGSNVNVWIETYPGRNKKIEFSRK